MNQAFSCHETAGSVSWALIRDRRPVALGTMQAKLVPVRSSLFKAGISLGDEILDGNPAVLAKAGRGRVALLDQLGTKAKGAELAGQRPGEPFIRDLAELFPVPPPPCAADCSASWGRLGSDTRSVSARTDGLSFEL